MKLKKNMKLKKKNKKHSFVLHITKHATQMMVICVACIVMCDTNDHHLCRLLCDVRRK